MQTIAQAINDADFIIELSGGFRLVSLQERHFQAYYELFDEEITRYQYPDPFSGPQEAELTLTQFMRQQTEGTDLVCMLEDSDGKIAGSVEAHGLDSANPEIGVWISRQFRRRGLAREAVLSLLAFMSRHMELESVIYEADERNEASIRLVRQLGGVWQSQEELTTQSGKLLKLNLYQIFPPFAQEGYL